jgi:hypothetical protein
LKLEEIAGVVGFDGLFEGGVVCVEAGGGRGGVGDVRPAAGGGAGGAD